MAPLLLFILFTFLTNTSLFSFYSLNPYLIAIFLSINISIIPLSKSALTIMSPYISTFFTPIFNHTSLNILNVLLIFFWLVFSFIILLGISVHALPCCAFFSIGYTTTPQFYYSFFFFVLHSKHRIFLFSCSNILSSIMSFFLHFIYYTLIISPLFASFSLQFYVF